MKMETLDLNKMDLMILSEYEAKNIHGGGLFEIGEFFGKVVGTALTLAKDVLTSHLIDKAF